MTAPTTTPTSVEARWFPASVLHPDGDTWTATRVILARGGDHPGLHVWRTRPDPGVDTADLTLPVNFARTLPLPPRDRHHLGVDIHLPDGRLVVVTAERGCGCGNRLKSWAGPSWATHSTVRRAR